MAFRLPGTWVEQEFDVAAWKLDKAFACVSVPHMHDQCAPRRDGRSRHAGRSPCQGLHSARPQSPPCYQGCPGMPALRPTTPTPALAPAPLTKCRSG